MSIPIPRPKILLYVFVSSSALSSAIFLWFWLRANAILLWFFTIFDELLPLGCTIMCMYQKAENLYKNNKLMTNCYSDVICHSFKQSSTLKHDWHLVELLVKKPLTKTPVVVFLLTFTRSITSWNLTLFFAILFTMESVFRLIQNKT